MKKEESVLISDSGKDIKTLRTASVPPVDEPIAITFSLVNNLEVETFKESSLIAPAFSLISFVLSRIYF